MIFFFKKKTKLQWGSIALSNSSSTTISISFKIKKETISKKKKKSFKKKTDKDLIDQTKDCHELAQQRNDRCRAERETRRRTCRWWRCAAMATAKIHAARRWCWHAATDTDQCPVFDRVRCMQWATPSLQEREECLDIGRNDSTLIGRVCRAVERRAVLSLPADVWWRVHCTKTPPHTGPALARACRERRESPATLLTTSDRLALSLWPPTDRWCSAVLSVSMPSSLLMWLTNCCQHSLTFPTISLLLLLSSWLERTEYCYLMYYHQSLSWSLFWL